MGDASRWSLLWLFRLLSLTALLMLLLIDVQTLRIWAGLQKRAGGK